MMTALETTPWEEEEEEAVVVAVEVEVAVWVGTTAAWVATTQPSKQYDWICSYYHIMYHASPFPGLQQWCKSDNYTCHNLHPCLISEHL